MNKWRVVSLLVMGALLAVLVAACGGSSSSTGGSDGGSTSSAANEESSPVGGSGGESGGSQATEVAAAKKFVAEHLGGIKFNPGEPYEVPKDITIGILSQSEANPGSAEIVEGVEAAAKAMGVKSQLVDGKGNPQGYNAGMQQLIQANVDVITMPGIADEALPQAMKEAAEAEIPVVGIGGGTRIAPPIENPAAASIDLPYALMGEMQANFMIAESNAEPQAVMFTDKAVPALYKISETTKEVFEECSGCDIKESVEVGEPENWTTKSAEVVQGFLAKYPEGEIEWIIPPFDAATQGMSEAVKAAGRDDIKAVSGGCIPEETGGLEEMRKGEGPVVFCNVVSDKFMGWAGANQAARLAAGLKGEDVEIPIVWYTEKNLPAEGQSYTPYDFESAYEKLWSEGS